MANGFTKSTALNQGSLRQRLGDRLSGFMELIRPFFFILTPVNAGSSAVLSLSGYPSLRLCVFGAAAVAFASCATNVFNDFIDRKRDKSIWPDRPLPSGRVKPSEALFVALVSLIISLSIAWFVFNTLTFAILLLALILGALYSAYLRDRVGYLVLPPIVGLIYLGGWAAFSPETLFHNLLPWYLYVLAVAWQTAHIMVYYPLHVVSPASGKSDTKKQPAFFFVPSPKTAGNIGLGFTVLTFILSAFLYFIEPLGLLYLILVMAAGVYAMINALSLQRDSQSRERGLKAFKSLSIFRLVISGSILLTVFLAHV